MQEGGLPKCWGNSPTYFTTESAQVGAPCSRLDRYVMAACSNGTTRARPGRSGKVAGEVLDLRGKTGNGDYVDPVISTVCVSRRRDNSQERHLSHCFVHL